MAKIDPQSWKQIAKEIKTLQQLPRNKPQTQGMPPNGNTIFIEALANGDITAMDGSTAGYGSAYLRTFDKSTRMFSTGSREVTVYNKTDKKILDGASITIGQMYGVWFVFVVDKCTNLE